jgi:diaminopimelate epimerase
MKLNFFKMHAQGNDYIFFDFINKEIPQLDLCKLSILLSNRNTGIGSDGIVLLLSDSEADSFMRIFNADGSEAKSCGSALRCATSYLHDKLGKNRIIINTLSGLKFGKVLEDDQIIIDLGKTSTSCSKYQLDNISGDLVQLGNTHFVIFKETLPDPDSLARIYKSFQEDEILRNSNLEISRIINPHKIEMVIWERGSGATLACGTGAVATVHSGLESGLLKAPVKVKMPGGEVSVELIEDILYLKGKVHFAFTGEVSI